MMCPRCEREVRNVIDSRPLECGTVTRRRRECAPCQYRFTTYERVETPEQRVFIGKALLLVASLRDACQSFLDSAKNEGVSQ